ncbi:hypothetical protein PLICRDRAFT_40295 [Plicaturopsis crispa FD-325 SS-3]|nr:hypothetical protein PLICRDRAFT_40295 [Plicaturopsis crispa FD-325 SS-3]
MTHWGFLFAFVVANVWDVAGQTWCGKNYMKNQSIVQPGGQFQTPSASQSPLVAFRCAPAIKPYLAEDGPGASFLIDAPVTYSAIKYASAITLPSDGSAPSQLMVTLRINGSNVGQGSVPLNASKAEIPLSLAGLTPQSSPYDVSCSASYAAPGGNTQAFNSTAQLLYLPNPTNGSVTKMDLKTGALLAKPANGSDGPYDTVFPIGFYTNFGGYLDTNLSVLNDLKAQGFTIVHPVPSFDNLTALDEVLDRMQEVGLYLMYDMRSTYQDASEVTEQVNRIMNRPNLLLWYTADEPDGTSDPLNATSIAQNSIQTLDGYRHPVSLVLNCQDYFFTDYASGADIVMQDTYPIGNNVTFASEWQTPCTDDFGCCGCDDCTQTGPQGNFSDIPTRMDEFAERLQVESWDRTKAVWTVPQAFGAAQYWPRLPTGKEYVVQSVLGINHGGLGAVAWNDPTPPDIKKSASLLAQALPAMKPYILSSSASFRRLVSSGIDVGLWSVGDTTLLLASNTNYAQSTLKLSDTGLGVGNVTQVFDSGARASGTDSITFDSVGSGAFLLLTKGIQPRQENSASRRF